MFKAGETTNKVQKARIRRTKYFFENRAAFLQDLKDDIQRGIKQAARAGLTPVFRLNGTSDLSWEKYDIIQEFPDIQFYDYTKVLGRKVAQLANYHLTFSRSEDNDADCLEAQRQGMNVATVYDRIPEGVFSAENDDLRFLDPKVGVIGLTAKGPAKKDYSGFVIRINQIA